MNKTSLNFMLDCLIEYSEFISGINPDDFSKLPQQLINIENEYHNGVLKDDDVIPRIGQLLDTFEQPLKNKFIKSGLSAEGVDPDLA